MHSLAETMKDACLKALTVNLVENPQTAKHYSELFPKVLAS